MQWRTFEIFWHSALDDGGWGMGWGRITTEHPKDLTVFEVFKYLESSACLYYCCSLLCLTSIKVSSIFLLPRLLHTPIRDSIIMFYLHLPLSLFSIIKYVIYRRSQRHIEGRANSSRSGYIYTISLQNMFTLKPWTSIQNKQYYTGKILIEYEI